MRRRACLASRLRTRPSSESIPYRAADQLPLRTSSQVPSPHGPILYRACSRGGAVAMNIKSGAAKLVLLCPAWRKYGTARTVKPGTTVLHSRADDTVPFADSEELVT